MMNVRERKMNVQLTADEINMIGNSLSYEILNHDLDPVYAKELRELYDKFDDLEREVS